MVKLSDEYYTPPAVMRAVTEWAVKEYNLEGREIIRPFFPGGDYEHQFYPENCVVIDNPPFSKQKEIKEFYLNKGIDFFLFTQSTTCFNGNTEETGDVCYVLCGARGITYARPVDGMRREVDTSFVTTMEPKNVLIRSASDLREKIDDAMMATWKEDEETKNKRKVTRYHYPDAVLTSSRAERIFGHYPGKIEIYRDEVKYVKNLEYMRQNKRGVYGSCYLLNTRKAKEIAEAEKIADANRTYNVYLTDVEQEIIDELDRIDQGYTEDLD